MKGLVLKDVRFCLEVQEVTGVIQVQDGLPIFYLPEQGIVARYPGNISVDDYGTTKKVWMYPSTHKLKLRLGKDDVPTEDMEDFDVDLNTDVASLDAMIDEERIRRVPRVLSAYAAAIASVVVGIGSFLLAKRSPIFWGLLALAVIVLLVNVVRGRSMSQMLSSPLVYDCDGAWINLETGETSLNGGYRVSHYKKEGSAL